MASLVFDIKSVRRGQGHHHGEMPLWLVIKDANDTLQVDCIRWFLVVQAQLKLVCGPFHLCIQLKQILNWVEISQLTWLLENIPFLCLLSCSRMLVVVCTFLIDLCIYIHESILIIGFDHDRFTFSRVFLASLWIFFTKERIM